MTCKKELATGAHYRYGRRSLSSTGWLKKSSALRLSQSFVVPRPKLPAAPQPYFCSAGLGVSTEE
ncbi:MAG: hypothetical protein IRZ03_17415 [Acidobacterium ailaaui]|nr:hypothetical protein [Pseudacidobacterium ailaaui]